MSRCETTNGAWYLRSHPTIHHFSELQHLNDYTSTFLPFIPTIQIIHGTAVKGRKERGGQTISGNPEKHDK